MGGDVIYHYRSVSIAPGKLGSSLAFAKEVTGFVKERTGVDVTIAMPIGGNPNRIGWAGRYENMELLAKAADLFIAGSAHDELWRSV
jgi:hypothetical protein